MLAGAGSAVAAAAATRAALSSYIPRLAMADSLHEGWSILTFLDGRPAHAGMLRYERAPAQFAESRSSSLMTRWISASDARALGRIAFARCRAARSACGPSGGDRRIGA
jgi:hypothetical protein